MLRVDLISVLSVIMPGEEYSLSKFGSVNAHDYDRHGPISECSKSVVLKIVMEYLDLPEDSSERRTLEQKFGKGVVLRLVRQYQEEKSTDEWLENSTTNCPGCKVHVEKSLGCNHVCW